MFDQAFTVKTISKVIRKSDFIKHTDLYDDIEKEKIIKSAVINSQKGFSSTSKLIKNKKLGKFIIKPAKFSDELILRKVSENIKKITGVKQKNRNEIVKNLISFLKEGVPYRVYKLDIKSFYESVDLVSVIDKLKRDNVLSNTTTKCAETFFAATQANGIKGLPRGVQLSATLAELVLRDFDKLQNGSSDIYFYSRFVDDIIIISSSSEDPNVFLGLLKKRLLPLGLSLNPKKQYLKKVVLINKNLTGILCDFSYLGYQFSVSNPSSSNNYKSISRDVMVDIAPKKVKRIKTRVVKSFLSYIDTHDYILLSDRLKVLTGNYSLVDRKTAMKRKTGIYYNYNHVSPESSSALKELDSFLQTALLSNKGRVYSKTNALLSKNEKRNLLKLTFSNGFKNKVFFDFNQWRLSEIMGCWKYE